MTGTLPVYRVTVTREDNLWVAVVDGLIGGATDVERLVDLETEARDLIAGLADLDPDDFEIEWHYVQSGHDLTPVLTRLREHETIAQDALRQRDEVRLAAINALRDARLSYRAIADVLGMSHQRVQQLATGRRPTGRKAS